MRLITLEEHFTTRLYEESAGGENRVGVQMPKVFERLLDLGDERLHAMDEAGIDMQILSFTGFGLYEMPEPVAIEVAHDANERTAEAMSLHPHRFGGFAALAAQSPEQAAREVTECVQKLGFKGAMLDDTVLRGAGLKLERSPLEVFQQNFWITTSGYFSVPPMLCARRVIGSNRIMLSIDYPFSEMLNGKRMLEDLRSDFNDNEIDCIAGDLLRL